MKGIRFDNIHTYDDLQLILTNKVIGSPAVKTNALDRPGADGMLDWTEFFGEVKYGNRSLSFDFQTMVSQSLFMDVFSKVENALHGRKMRILLDDDPAWYYIGRVIVSDWKAERRIGKLTIDCDCEPYKYKIDKTVVQQAVNGTVNVTLLNGRKRAVPEVKVETEGSMNIVFQSVNVWDLGNGSYTLPELELVEGENIVTLTGTGTVTFTWQEASL